MKNVKFRGKDEFRGEIPRLKFRGKNPNSADRLEIARGPRKTVGPILMMQSLIHVGLPCLDPGTSIPLKSMMHIASFPLFAQNS